jgi:predicted phosphodiesterase
MALSSTLLAACGKTAENSPWSQDVPYESLTATHLARLASVGGPASDFKVALIGDPQMVQGDFREAIKKINEMDVDFVAVLGDLTDLGLRREWLWVGDAIARSRHPVLTVVGNHDGLSKGSAIYKKMFGEYNYSFVHKGVKFVMWNNNFLEFGPPEVAWLDGEVSSHERVVVMAHQPPGEDVMPTETLDAWRTVRGKKSYKASLHGHLHKFGFYNETETDTLVYTVSQVSNAVFGVMTVKADKIIFQNCTTECVEVSK